MRTGAAFAAAMVLAVITAGGAGAAISRVDLVGPDGNFLCGSGEVFSGEPGGFGTVVIRQRGDEVSAVVQLRGAEPRATHQVRLIQISDDAADCHVGATEVTSNAAGRLIVQLREPVAPTTVGFNVAINSGTIFGAPHWVGAQTLPRS